MEVQEADQSFAELQNSFKQVKMMQEGTIEKQMAKDFLDELSCNASRCGIGYARFIGANVKNLHNIMALTDSNFVSAQKIKIYALS